MIPDGFVEGLIEYADIQNGDTGSAGTDELKNTFKSLYDQVKAGKGAMLANSAVSGKTFGFHISMTVEEAFSAFARAIKELDGSGTPITYGAFYGLTR